MRKWIIPALVMILATTAIASSSSDHHPSAKDLIFPFMNLTILLIAMFVLLKDKVKSYFADKSKNIAEVLQRANVKMKEAKLLLESQKKKLYVVDEEAEAIMGEAQKEVEKFNKEHDLHIKDRVEKTREDAIVRMEHERNSLVAKLNNELVEEVLVVSKKMIQADNDKRSKISKKLVEEINN